MMNRNRSQKIPHAGPSNKLRNQGDLHRIPRIIPDNAFETTQLSGGRSYIDITTGPWTYMSLPVVIVSDVAIAGETYRKGGQHIVKTQHFSKYVSSMALRVNAQILLDYHVDELIKKNDYEDAGMLDGFVGFVFTNYRKYNDQRVADLFALGTGNLRNVKVEMLQTSAFDSATMKIECRPIAVHERKPALYLKRSETLPFTFNGAGQHLVSTIGVGDDIESIFIDAEGITRIELEADGVKQIDGSLADVQNYLLMAGKDPSAFGNKFFIDFHALGVPTSLAAMSTPEQVSRGARIKLKITTTQANTEVVVRTNYAGLLVDIA